MGFNAVFLSQRGREGFDLLEASRREKEVSSVRSKGPSAGLADSGGGTCNEDAFSGESIHEKWF